MSKSPLLEKVRDQMRLHHYSLRTEESYVQWIKRFILFHGKRHPAEMGEQEITAFLTDLAVRKNVAASTQRAGGDHPDAVGFPGADANPVVVRRSHLRLRDGGLPGCERRAEGRDPTFHSSIR